MDKPIFSFLSSTPQETRAFGRKIAALCIGGECLTLEGELGAGKTELARGFIVALSGNGTEVTSPTFSLLQIYPCAGGRGQAQEIWHYDLYRIAQPEELTELGLEDAWRNEHIVLIEWPDRAEGRLPENRLRIHVNVVNETSRQIVGYGNSVWQSALKSLE